MTFMLVFAFKHIHYKIRGRKHIPECIDQSAALSTSIQNKKMLLLLHLPISKINFHVVASL